MEEFGAHAAEELLRRRHVHRSLAWCQLPDLQVSDQSNHLHIHNYLFRPAYDEFMIVANSHRYTSSEDDRRKVFFGIVDYEEAPQIFQQMNLNTAPILYHFGPKLSGKKRPEQMDFQRQGFDADAIARFVVDQTEVQVRVIRPPNYTAPVVIGLFVALLLGMLYMKRNSLDFLFNRTVWGFVCLAITFTFMSGQMWNHIRGPPFMITNPNTKEPSFIHGSTQFQLIAETYIVAGLYALVAVGFIFVNEAADQTNNDKEKKQEKKKSNSPLSLLNIPPNSELLPSLLSSQPLKFSSRHHWTRQHLRLLLLLAVRVPL